MVHPLVLTIVLSLVIHDGQASSFNTPPWPGSAISLAVLGSMSLVAMLTQMAMVLIGRRLDRTGRLSALKLADRALALSRLATGALFLAVVFLLDWVGVVRGVLGDWIGLDELIAMAPPLLVYAAGIWSFEPIDRRLHEALLIRALDSGRTVHPIPQRGAYTWEKLRTTALAALVPLLLILLWGEATTFFLAQAEWPWPLSDDRMTMVLAATQLAGAGVVLTLSPPLLLRLWDTMPLPEGDIRDRLNTMCHRHGVRCGGVRLWRTRGLVLNGAVLGLMPRLRYILLTDALVENLQANQLEAVMAHEIGHVRRRHMPWLLITLAVSIGFSAWVIEAALGLFGPMFFVHEAQRGGLFDAGIFLLVVLAGLVLFGFVSRLFERQADAFAVQNASGATRRNRGAGITIPCEAAESMAGALETVARLNHIPLRKFTWRHGSIAERCRRIRGLVGTPANQVRVDRSARLVRWVAGVGMFALIVAMVLTTE